MSLRPLRVFIVWLLALSWMILVDPANPLIQIVLIAGVVVGLGSMVRHFTRANYPNN